MLTRTIGAVLAATFPAILFVASAATPRAADTPVTFTKDVAPILYKNCVSCHRDGEMAPMSLVTYKDARPWAKSIRRNVVEHVMPPWHADPAHSRFSNARGLSQAEIDTIVAWVDRGAPQGKESDLPPAPTYPDGWDIGIPDAVYEMPEEFDIPADGVVEYQYFTVQPNFTEDRWVQAAEIRAGNRELVHHVIVFVDEPGGSPSRAPGIQMIPSTPARSADASTPAAASAAATPSVPATSSTPAASAAPRRQARPLGRLLVGQAPGARPAVFPLGSAKRIKAGSTLTFQMHYTPNGAAGKDRTRVGLIFAKQPPASEIRTVGVMNTRFVIPAGDANHQVLSKAEFTEDAKIWSFFPHMHVRGKSFEYRIVRPDGSSQVLLSVPRYDFNWQGEYVLAEPISVTKGTRLECTAFFDNSKANLANPDPSKDVRWGDQTWEEMMIGWTTFSVEPTTTTASKP
jgi:mono/diheme cytochrome c family protein